MVQITPNPAEPRDVAEKPSTLAKQAVENRTPQNLAPAWRPKIVSRAQVVSRSNALDGTAMFCSDEDYPKQAVHETRVGHALRSEKTPKGKALSIGPGDPLTATRLTLKQGTNTTNLKSIRGKYRFVPSAELKSDVVKIHGRRIVEIAAGGEKYSGNSTKINSSRGAVHIIAGNRKKGLQKMVKGDNLVAALKEIMERIAQMNESIRAIKQDIILFKAHATLHVHPIVPIVGPAVPSPTLAVGLGISAPQDVIDTANNIGMTCNNEIYKVNWLEPTSPTYILSHWNKVN
jgi:hypothetical protein